MVRTMTGAVMIDGMVDEMINERAPKRVKYPAALIAVGSLFLGLLFGCAATATNQLATNTFRDCSECPLLTELPSGRFAMGSPQSDPERGEDEGPVRQISIGEGIAVGVYPITRGEFAYFVEQADYRTSGPCNQLENQQWVPTEAIDWRNPGYAQTDRHPVVCVSWNDAQAYVDWLTQQTQKTYRLITEAEWEYAAKSGTRSGEPAYPISHDRANYGTPECCGPLTAGKDVWPNTSPVGSFPANAFGLFDQQGNTWEWMQDCVHDSYQGAPLDGSARMEGCDLPDWRVVRGGSWGDAAIWLRPSYRLRAPLINKYFTLGFRVARTD